MTKAEFTPLEDIHYRQERRGTKAEISAGEAAIVAEKVKRNRDRMVSEAADLIVRTGNGALDNEGFRKFKQATAAAEQYNSLLTTLKAMEREKRGTAVAIKSEPKTYGRGRPENSYFLDLATRAGAGSGMSPFGDVRAATERLDRYDREVAAEVAKVSRPDEGRRAARSVRELNRTDESGQPTQEQRAVTTGSASGGSFVTPQYVVAQWAEFRSPHRSFVDQCQSLPMPEYGMTVYVPSVTSSSSVGQQSAETAGVPELDPTGVYLSSSVNSLVGQVTVSQQAYDRGGQPGLAFDLIVGQQLRNQLDAQIDTFVINQALANAGTVTDTSAFSITNLYADLSAAREKLTDTAGTRLRGTHLFTSSDLFGHVSSQVDSQARPIILPEFAAEPWSSLVAAGDPKGEGWTGHVMPGGLAWFADDSIPASGANTQLIVARPSEIIVFEGDPVAYAWPETDAPTLSVVVGLKAYVAAIPRYQKAVAVIGGSGYPLTLT